MAAPTLPSLHTSAVGHGVSLLPPEMIDSGRAGAFVAYGQNASVIIASRDAGYHSKPHRHAAEQINYLLSGEAWVFIEQEGFLMKPGDILRIPADTVHWAWVRGASEASVVEVHTPPLTADYAEGRVSLLTTAVEEGRVQHVGNQWVEDFDWRAVEQRVAGACYEA